ncbi:DUF302 domain-containing protein [Thiovibrio frasassiensis]|uniref:DUF302 domain-containing protein n=1 Tax=Thiovibrio frasassiensis TaxID=2984131 RepID=A0A9X4MED2_9BACT|nr:DUF302 domain-containing protein [Thiovibrio frasassiensis]MDG4474776.1 DUF302 domain-containing protein [Thiovibrio frasassiensis]
MKQEDLYLAETGKSPAEFARDFAEVVTKYGFIINNADTMDMGKTFRAHGAQAGQDFDLHMIQICKPEKAAKSLAANPERSVLMPKFVMAFSKEGKTQLRFLSYNTEDISLIVADAVFPGSLAESFQKIREMIDEAR